MTLLDAWLHSQAFGFVLASTRAAGLIIVAPLAWTGAPVKVRIALVLLLGMIGNAEAPPRMLSVQYDATFAPLVIELFIGMVMGFVVRLAVASAEIAGESMAPVIGLGAAQMFDPGAQAPQNVLGKLMRYLVILVALSVGVHRVVLESLVASYRVLPPGSSGGPAPAVPMLLNLTSEAFATGVRIALPLLAVLFMTQLALAFIARAAPAMQIFNVGFTVTLGVGGLMMILLLPDMTRSLVADLTRIGPRIETLIAQLGARL